MGAPPPCRAMSVHRSTRTAGAALGSRMQGTGNYRRGARPRCSRRHALFAGPGRRVAPGARSNARRDAAAPDDGRGGRAAGMHSPRRGHGGWTCARDLALQRDTPPDRPPEADMCCGSTSARGAGRNAGRLVAHDQHTPRALGGACSRPSTTPPLERPAGRACCRWASHDQPRLRVGKTTRSPQSWAFRGGAPAARRWQKPGAGRNVPQGDRPAASPCPGISWRRDASPVQGRVARAGP